MSENAALRDRIAELLGEWKQSPDGLWYKPEWGEDHVRSVRAGCLPRHDHPIPNTLDAAAKCLPEGWEWIRTTMANDDHPLAGHSIIWTAYKGLQLVFIYATGNEITDRFTLALKALESQGGK